MKAPLFIGPIAGVLTMIVVGCSTAPTPPDQNVAAFCTDWAKAKCQIASTCQFDPAVCTTFQTQVCNDFAVAAQASGTRLYNQANGKACIDALNGAYTSNATSILASELATLDATCNKAFAGSTPPHSPCTTDFDCTGGLFCVQVPGQTSRVCATVTDKNLGDYCADPGDSCQGQSFCGPTPAGPQCIATAGTGNNCSAALPCGPSDRCVAGVCTARAGQGGPCATSADCGSNAPYCDTYPPASCVTMLTFGRGSYDCNGIGGTNEPVDAGPVGPVGADASVVDSSTPPADAASGG
jgi:hypothetical protein